MKKYDSKPYKLPDYPDTDVEEIEKEENEEQEVLQLIIFNDEINTFQFVEETLQTVCGHTVEQSQQCSLLIHTKGRCSVKQGSYKKLKPMLEEILFRKIVAMIE